ncbi:MAG: sulfite exporter TauE/SafE family protein [Aestuariivirga sp.]
MNLFPDISSSSLMILVLIGLVAGLSRGFSGFGAALIFVPLAGALIGPRLAAPLLAVIDGIFASYLIPSAFRLGNKSDVALMFAGALVGVPAGTFILTHYEPLVLRWLIAGMATAMLVLLASGWRYHGKPHKAATVVVGAISGLFSGIAQIGGPPVVSYWMGTNADMQTLRANIILFFAATTVITVVTYFTGGLLTVEVLKFSLFAGPAYGIGTVVGSRIFRMASPQVFRTVSLVLIAFAVLTSLPLFG